MFIQTVAESSAPITALDSVIAGVAYGVLSGAAKLMTRDDDTLVGKAGRACGQLAGMIAAVSVAISQSKPMVKVNDYDCTSDFMGQAGAISLVDAVLHGAKPICKDMYYVGGNQDNVDDTFQI